MLVYGGVRVGFLYWWDALSGANDFEDWRWRITCLFANRMYEDASPSRMLTAISHLLRRRIEACKALLWSSCSVRDGFSVCSLLSLYNGWAESSLASSDLRLKDIVALLAWWVDTKLI